jgi:hypothetical protein
MGPTVANGREGARISPPLATGALDATTARTVPRRGAGSVRAGVVSSCGSPRRTDAVAEPTVATGLTEQAGVASRAAQRFVPVVDELAMQQDVVLEVHDGSSRVMGDG